MTKAAKKPSSKNLRKFSFSRPQLIVFVVIFAAIGGYALYRSFAASTINVWVSTTGNDSTCVRGNSAKPCATLVKAYDIAQAGDNVQVACGSYDWQEFDSHKSSGAQIVFEPSTDYCATLGGIEYTDGGDYSTLKGFTLTNVNGVLYQGGESYTYGVTLDSNHFNVGQRVDTQNINVHAISGWKIINNIIGPSCCGADGSSPEGIRIGTPGDINSTNVLIDNNTIQFTSRFCQYWPSSGFGSCPGQDCSECHMDGIHIFGLTNSTISNNKIISAEVQGIFIEDTNGGLNSSINIINNMVTTVGGNAGISVEARSNTHSLSGNWTIAFNTTPDLIEIDDVAGASAGTTHFNITGNIGQLYINQGGCQGFEDSNVSATYAYNLWEPVGGGTDTPCGTGDTTGNPAFVNALTDLHLTSSNHLVPASVCTAITTIDIDGQSRPANGGSFCDAGADEFGAVGGGGGGGTTGDTTPPSVSMSAPSGGATVSGSSVAVSANASDDVAVSSVQFKLDGNNLGNADTSSPYTTTWDTTGASNGTHTLTAVATDSSGNSTTSNSVNVTVSNSGGTSSTLNIGEINVLPSPDSNNVGIIPAQSATLSQTATIQSLSFYVTAAAGKLRLGIYDSSGSGGGPGNLKAQTAEITPVVGWNTANVVTPVSLTAGTYWLAYSPSSGALAFLKTTDSTSSGMISDFTYGVLPATFPAGARTNAAHWSFYATLTTGSGGTTPVIGDLNNDSHVSLPDLTILLANWHTTNAVADINSSGQVDTADLSILLSHYGT